MLVHGCTFMSISRYKNTDRLWNCVINIEKFERFNYIMKRKLFFNTLGINRPEKEIVTVAACHSVKSFYILASL